MLSLLWAQVQSLVGELGSHKLHGVVKKKKKSDMQLNYIKLNGIWKSHS